jgi:steroid delta-isomerase-like uncharacterized protein
VIKKLFEGINQSKNINTYDDLCDTNYLYYSPSITRDPLTLEKVKAFASMLIQAFPDVHYTIKKIFADGEYVIVWNVFSGTHEGTYQGIPATGNKINVSSVLIFLLKDGKIVEEREEADMLGALMQLGMDLQLKNTE